MVPSPCGKSHAATSNTTRNRGAEVRLPLAELRILCIVEFGHKPLRSAAEQLPAAYLPYHRPVVEPLEQVRLRL